MVLRGFGNPGRLGPELRAVVFLHRARAVGAFPDDTITLLIVNARHRHIVGKTWGIKLYRDMTCLSIPPNPADQPRTACPNPVKGMEL